MRVRQSSLLALTAALASTSLYSTPAEAQSCDPARLMIILDQSSSMSRNSIMGETLWTHAVNALTTVVGSFEDKLQLGLMKFPEPNECNPGAVFVTPALNTATAITDELTTAPPTGGNYTPMYQTLNVAEGVPELNQNDVPNHVVLITDGWQWCSSEDDPADRFKPIDEVEDLAAKGITTYVVGFGGSVDTLTLNGMAVAGGTAIPGCDPTSSDPAASDNCYFQADNPDDLVDALTAIANSASEEVCDGIDNDCDGQVDEGLTQECSTDCGTGSETCINGTWMGCDAPEPETEVCDGEDNDCDGTTDPGCACLDGDSRPCGEESEVGACQPGTQECQPDNTWGDCEGSVGPGNEMCNGEDDDCDGVTDEATFEGEVSPGLCGPGFECINGNCDPVDPMTPPDDEEEEGSIPAIDDGGTAAGCGCRTSPGTGGAAFGFLALLGLMGVLRRRRR